VPAVDAASPAGRVQDCLVRVIPGIQASTHSAHATGHEGSKFGLSPAAAKDAVARIEASDRLRVLGLHTHVGAQIMDAGELAAAVAPLAALGRFPVYDLGGGLGARYPYDDHPPALAPYPAAPLGAV